MTSPTDPVESLEYDSDADRYRITYDTATTAPSAAVLSGLEWIAPGRLERGDPLYDAIDPDALDRILASAGEDETAAGRSVRFSYLGFRIAVFGEGYLEVRPARDGKQEAGSK
ncbi:HalOD1 output domain-containing protein [Halosolutus halophilus]|uniref:HalOD1 output domain-containing protein n=1 Tax=Halosolutus halophilus TaxID=1552990 RepID=UPI00223515F2|nr:HalOD1 output domain-containing protein [Halosolutus halophilus]